MGLLVVGLRWGAAPLPAPSRLDFGDVDLVHRHHCLERTCCLGATGSLRVSEHARRDLPGKTPAVLAPPTGAFFAVVADERVPVTVRFFLIVRSSSVSLSTGMAMAYRAPPTPMRYRRPIDAIGPATSVSSSSV